MTARFRRLDRYPSGFSNSWGNNQSSVPSQNAPVPAAFDPVMKPARMPTPPTGFPSDTIVRATYDSRPLNAYDFFFEEFFLGGTPFNGAGTSGYVVPPGYVLILREIVIAGYNTGVNSAIMNPFGGWDTADGIIPPFLRILVDGAQTPSFAPGNLQLLDFFITDVQIPCFIPISGGSRLQVILPLFAQDDPAGLGITPFDTFVHYFGNMLLSTGRDTSAEVGNAEPEPVHIADAVLPVHEVGK
jgi:hypothetical protein